MSIGVLDIQGSVEEHAAMLEKLGVKPVLVKSREDLGKVSGLIIPGGESTTISKLLASTGLFEEIRRRANPSAGGGTKSPFGRRRADGRYPPLVLWGTCAGAIMLAKKVTNKAPKTLKLMNVEISRNGYGRQLDSFETEISAPSMSKGKIPAIFIRAPRIKSHAKHVAVLASHENEPVMVEEKNLMATTFHPELTGDTRIHQYFIRLVAQYA